MPEPPFFSVIIPTCNRPQTLSQCLRKLETQTPQAKFHFETLVGDDSPDTRTRDLLAQHHPRVIWVKGPRKGPAANRNQAARKAKGTWLIFIDDDTEPEPTFLESYHAMAQTGTHKVLEGRLACPDKRNSPFYRMPENLQGGLFTSGNIAFEKETFEQLGGFDEDLVVMEDLEIGHRIRTRGIPHTFCAGASAHHRAQKFGLGHLLWWSFHHRWGILYDYKTQAKPLSMPLPAAILHTLAKHILLLMRTTWHLFSQHDPNTWKNRWFWQIWGWVSLPLTLPCLISSEPKFRRMAQSSQKV